MLRLTKATRKIVGGRLIPPLLFFLLTLSAQGQVAVRGDLFREILAKSGTIINLNLGVANQSDGEATIVLAKLDYTAGKSAPAGSSPRSLASWITLPAERMTLAGKAQSEILLKLIVPETIKPGSYWSAITISSMVTEPAPEKGIRVGIRTLVIVQICVTIPGGVRDARVGEPEVKGMKMIVPLIGTGNECFVVKITATGLPEQSIRVFPGVTRTLEYSIEEFPDGEHELRFLLDDGAHFILPTWKRFVKVPPPPVALAAFKAEERRRRQTLRGNIYAVLSYGTIQKGFSIQGSASYRFLKLSSGTDQMIYRDSVYQGYSTKAGINFGPVTVTAGRSWYGPITLTTASIALSVRRLNLQVAYTPEYKLITTQAGWRIWKNISVSVWGTAGFETGRRDWRASLQIPII